MDELREGEGGGEKSAIHFKSWIKRLKDFFENCFLTQELQLPHYKSTSIDDHTSKLNYYFSN